MTGPRVGFFVCVSFLVPLLVVPRSMAADSLEKTIEKAMPNVVLLLNWRADDKLGYGSGILLNDSGMVLTSLHVVANAKHLGAMLYDEKRMAYTPMDGGLARYIFENKGAILPLQFVRGDPTLDLAVVKITSQITVKTTLPFAKQEPKRGQNVYALGHPQESVWSFSAGHVSNLQHGAVQHSAPVNMGNSGGPLINDLGEVVGINVSKVMGNAEGVAFARPMDLAEPLMGFIRAFGTSPTMDLSTPAAAAKSCFLAEELHSPDLLDCSDIENLFFLFREIARRGMGQEGMPKEEIDKEIEKFDRIVQLVAKSDGFRRMFSKLITASDDPDNIARVLGEGMEQEEDMLSKVAGVFGAKKKITREEFEKKVKKQMLATKEIQAMLGKDDSFHSEWEKNLLKKNNLKIDTRNMRARKEILKMGVRIGEVHLVDHAHAWVAFTGRNLDASEYRSSQYRVLKDGRWLEQIADTKTLESLPKDWAPPLVDMEQLVSMFLAQIKAGKQFENKQIKQ